MIIEIKMTAEQNQEDIRSKLKETLRFKFQDLNKEKNKFKV
jgi:hypothetical protein